MNRYYCPLTGKIGCRIGCDSQPVNTDFYDAGSPGLACGPDGSCNSGVMNPKYWGQSIQGYQTAYPVSTTGFNNNITVVGQIKYLPTAYGVFLPYNQETWEIGDREKLESLDWRLMRGRELGPGTLV